MSNPKQAEVLAMAKSAVENLVLDENEAIEFEMEDRALRLEVVRCHYEDGLKESRLVRLIPAVAIETSVMGGVGLIGLAVCDMRCGVSRSVRESTAERNRVAT